MLTLAIVSLVFTGLAGAAVAGARQSRPVRPDAQRRHRPF